MFAYAIANFIILVFLVYFLTKKKRRAVYQARRNVIKEKIEEAVNYLNFVVKQNNDAKNKILNIEKDTIVIKKSHKEIGQHKYNEIITEAQKKTELISKDSEAFLIHRREKVLKEIRQKILLNIFAKTSQKLKKDITKKDHKKLLDKSIMSLNNTYNLEA